MYPRYYKTHTTNVDNIYAEVCQCMLGGCYKTLLNLWYCCRLIVVTKSMESLLGTCPKLVFVTFLFRRAELLLGNYSLGIPSLGPRVPFSLCNYFDCMIK